VYPQHKNSICPLPNFPFNKTLSNLAVHDSVILLVKTPPISHSWWLGAWSAALTWHHTHNCHQLDIGWFVASAQMSVFFSPYGLLPNKLAWHVHQLFIAMTNT
jgi:hypothetical protein